MIEIRSIINDELSAFDKKFNQTLKSKSPLLDRVIRYIISQKGKQIRPMLVFLCARTAGGIVSESTYHAASMVELLHTATLVHDDVVDESMERRGLLSINAIWKNKVAVLVGDFLLSKGLLLATGHKEYELLHYLSDAVRRMSEGELLQIEKSRKLNLDESVYFEIIRNKTASLLAAACAIGAFSNTKSQSIADEFYAFGEKMGIAFQLKDDLLDYGSKNIGKPTGNDIKEKKLTLPLIYTIQQAEKKQRRELIYILKNKNKDPDAITFVINAVKKAGGIDYATESMNQYRLEALTILQRFNASAYRDALEKLVLFTTERTH
jgi:octaprenyl-diphosphate synthase